MEFPMESLYMATYDFICKVKHMPKGDNKTVINFTTELKQFADSNKGDLERSFHVALTYLAHYKDEFIAKYGQECYDDHVKRYSIPAIELRNNSVQRKKESLALKRRELELREKELELKTKFLNAETQVMNDKHTDKAEHEKKLERIKLERELRALEHNYRTKEDLTRMNEIRVALGIRLANPQVAQEPQQQPHP